MKGVVIFITCANKREARGIAAGLVKNRLAACVNIIDKIESFFWWEGKIDRAKEALLVVKSRSVKLPGIIRLVKSRHSYQVPEIIALTIASGEDKYLKWLDESVR